MQMTQTVDAPRYLVMAMDGILYGYERLDVLLCDLVRQGPAERDATVLYEMQAGLTTRYVPTTYATLRAAYAAQN